MKKKMRKVLPCQAEFAAQKALVLATINKDEKKLAAAVTVIFGLQESEEQEVKATTLKNRWGFTAWDGKYLSEIAEVISKQGRIPKEFVHETRWRMQKYARQLVLVGFN